MSMRVLYIDDFACNADIVRQALARQAPGIELEVADSCASARARLVDTNQARADVLLIELALPDGGGIELLKAARMADPPLPAVVILERADYDSIVRAVREGAQAYLLRQGDYLANLAALLREILDRYRCQSALMREREVLQETRENWMHVLDTSALALFKLAWRDGCFVPRWTSHNLKNILGNDDVMTEESWLRHIHPDDRERVLTARGTLQGEGKVITEYRFRHRDGHYLWLRDRQFALRDETGNIHDIVGTLLDITRDRKFGLLHDARIAVRDRIFDGASLEDVLGEIICRLEDAFPDWRAMIWLAGETSLFPALDVARTKGTIYQSGQSPAPAPASQYDCIARALVHTGQFHLTLDGKRAAGSCCNCPLAQSGGDGDGDEGVYAIWSQPLRTAAGEALGVLNFCSRRQPPPEPEMPARLEEFSFLIVMAVERTRMELKLRQAAAVLESTSEGVIITNPRTIIVSVNQAWCDITGYRREEVIGHSPAQIQPGLHDTALYRNIWKTLNDTNIWEGEISNRRKSGEIYPQFLRIRAVRDSGGMLTHYVGVMSDLSFLKKNEREREWLAHYDPLTGLPNRLLGLSRLEHAVEQARQNGQRLALICLDIDHFQTINDSLGHAAGDQLLQILSARLNECAPGDGAVFRLGGDEFMVLLENLNGPDEAARIAQTILEIARAPRAGKSA
jgi:diguanylate cyclase (GGDEF)-like protein/PAS domain S-box-containing protein